MNYRFFTYILLIFFTWFSVPAAPVQTFTFEAEGKTYSFQSSIRNRQWKILQGKPDSTGRWVYRNNEGETAVIATDQFLTTEKGKQAELHWNFDVVNLSDLQNIAVVLRLPLRHFQDAEIQVGDKTKFQISQTPLSAPQLGRGRIIYVKTGEKTLTIALNRQTTVEWMDMRRFNPDYRECELRFFVISDSDASVRKGTVKFNMELYSGRKSLPEEKNRWQEKDTINQVVQPGKNWRPFTFDWRDCCEEPVWGNFGIEAPAGKYGFLKADGAVFKAGNRRIRLWGCCLSGGKAAAPSREDAVSAARFLRSRGYNAVRFTHLDASWGVPLDDRRGAVPAMSPERLDRFFFFLNELRKQGIYYVMDGMHDFDFPGHLFRDWNGEQRRGGAKLLISFSRKLQEYHNAYLRLLFTTKNPYSGLVLADDPALAGIQLINEIFLLRSAKQYCTYADFPASVREEVQTAWNDWLGTRGERIVDFDQAGSEGRLLFFQEMQSRNFKRMYRFLREELGVKPPIATTSCYVGPAMLPLALDGDYTEGHAYFSHPQAAVVDGRNMRALFARPGFYGGNYLTLIPFALSQRIGYQPYVVGEWNSCVPERFDLPLLMSAFANIQDIDGAFLFQLLQCGWEDAAARSIDTFGTIGDPGILVNMIPAALAWHRGYVPRAAMELGVKVPGFMTRGNCVRKKENSADFGKVVDAEGNEVGEANTSYHFRLFSQSAFLFRTFVLPETEEAGSWPAGMKQLYFYDSLDRIPPDALRKARAERVFLQSGNTARIDTPRYVALWGVLGGREHRIGALRVESPAGEEFSVSAVSLDGLPLAESGKVLVALASAACAEKLELLERRKLSGEELPRVIWKRASRDAVMRPITASFSFLGNVRRAFRVSVAGKKEGELHNLTDTPGIFSWKTSVGEGAGFYLLER